MTVPPVDQSRQKDERMWGMLCHLTALSGFIGIPFGWIIGPLVVWLIKKNDYSFVEDQGKEALNFQISMFIYLCIATLIAITTFFLIIPILLIPAVFITNVILVIIASIKANEGTSYRYPLTIRFLK